MQKHIFSDVLRKNKVLARVLKINQQFQHNTTLTSLKPKNPAAFISASPLGEDEDSSKDDFISIVVSKLGTILHVPEDPVVKQDEVTYDMFFIAKAARAPVSPVKP